MMNLMKRSYFVNLAKNPIQLLPSYLSMLLFLFCGAHAHNIMCILAKWTNDGDPPLDSKIHHSQTAMNCAMDNLCEAGMDNLEFTSFMAMD